MKKTWSDEGWDDYLYWQEQDRKTLRKINRLIRSIERDGAMKGEGKPEPLLGDLQGCFSRRIDDKNRLIYQVCGASIEILGCRDHYRDK